MNFSKYKVDGRASDTRYAALLNSVLYNLLLKRLVDLQFVFSEEVKEGGYFIVPHSVEQNTWSESTDVALSRKRNEILRRF